MIVTVSSLQVISATASSSGGRILTLLSCSSVRSLLRETVLHEFFQCESFSGSAICHELLQCGSLPWNAVRQKEAAPRSVMGTSMGCRCVFVRHRGSFWQLLAEAIPVALLPCRPCHANLIGASKRKGSRFFLFLAVVLKKIKLNTFGR